MNTSSSATEKSTVAGRFFVALSLAAALLGSTVPSPLYPHYQELWSLSSTFVTSIFSTYALGVLGSLLLLGRYADRIADRRVILLAGLTVIGAGALTFAFAPGPNWLLLGRLLAGMGTGVMVGAANAALLELDPKNDRQRAAVIGTLAFTAGGALGPVLSGLALQWNLWPTVLPFLMILLTAGIAFVGLLRSQWTSRLPAASHEHELTGHVPARELLKSLGFPFLLAIGALVLSWSIASVFVATGSSVALHLAAITNPALTGLLVSLFQGLGSITQTLFRKVAFKQAIFAGVLTVAVGQVGFFAAATLHSPIVFLIATAFAGLGYGAAFVGTAGLINYIAPARSRVKVVSWFYMCGYIVGNALPAVAVGILADVFGLYTALGIFSGIMVAFAAYIMARASQLRV